MNNQYFIDLLHSRKLKATSPRLNLLIKMQEYKTAMPYSVIQKTMKSVDRVTLYRILESLKEKGIIHKAFEGNKESYFAICSNRCSTNHHNHNHIHFKCEKCESVTCEKPTNNIKVSIPDIEIHKVSIHIEGVCKSCKEKIV